MLLIALFGALAIIFLSSLSWRRSITAIFFILVFEGALRKWVLPQASDLIYFLKDLVLIGAYLKYYFLSESEQKIYFKSYTIKVLIFLAGGWCLFQAFNPSLGSPIIGLFGLRGYLFYIPLMWMLPNLFETEDDLYKFLRSHLLLIIPVGLLGIAQFLSPVSSPLNVYAGGQDPTAGFSGTDTARITGTFSYISGYSVYLSVSFALLLPVLLKKQPRWWQLASITELVLVVANSFMTGSRGVVLFQALFLVSYLSLLPFKQAAILGTYVKRFAMPAVITFAAAATWFRSAFDLFFKRSTNADNLGDRIAKSFRVIDYFQYKQLDGYGVGSTHQASNTIRNLLGLASGEPIATRFESEFGRIALEIGPLGFAFWYGLRLALLASLGVQFWRLKRPFLYQLALAAFLTHLIQLPAQLVVHHTFSIYYWFLSSFIFLLPHLERVENWHQYQLMQNNSEADAPYFSGSSHS